MTCKHCNEPIEKNVVRRSLEPFFYKPWKHSGTHLIGCFDSQGNKMDTVAEPKESE